MYIHQYIYMAIYIFINLHKHIHRYRGAERRTELYKHAAVPIYSLFS